MEARIQTRTIRLQIPLNPSSKTQSHSQGGEVTWEQENRRRPGRSHREGRMGSEPQQGCVVLRHCRGGRLGR